MIELLKEAVPAISRIAVLWNPDHADPEFQETQRAATALGVRLQSLEVRQPGDFDAAFNKGTSEHPEGLIIVSSRLLLQRRRQIVEFGAKNGIIMAGDWGIGRKMGCCSHMVRTPLRPCGGSPSTWTRSSRAPALPSCP